jgi:uncharacterized protein YjbJ (UPF0337 family)
MAWNEIEGYWQEFSGEAKKRWAKLTDNDLVECRGNRDVLVGKLRQLYGITADEAGQQIGEMERRVTEASAGAQRLYGAGRQD